MLTESALLDGGRLVVAPAMNVRMWEHPATPANAAPLRERGAVLVGPEAGELAEGEVGHGPPGAARGDRRGDPGSRSLGAGRAASRGDGCSSPPAAHASRSTRVRYLGNRSTGRMGVALAEEAPRAEREVTTLLGSAACGRPPVRSCRVGTTADLEREALARAAGWPTWC